jgi:hypothetical protein
MNTEITSGSRFCYSYKPPGIIKTCCDPVVCATNEYISSIASSPMIINNSTRTTERSLLLSQQQQMYQAQYSTSVSNIVQYTNDNISQITSTLQGQLLQIKNDRTLPYTPYVYPVVPSSVMQLQMATVNVGVPMPVFTIANCKGSQSVTTTSDTVIY